MSFITISSPHLFNGSSTAAIMRWVSLATLPALVLHCYFFGWGTVINVVVAIIAALVFEAAILFIRRRDIVYHLTDYSAVTTAVFLGLSLPPYAPWWLIVLGSAIAMIFGKHIYGGLGQNPFNPAMVAYAMLLVGRPIEMTTWAPAVMHGDYISFWQTISWKFAGMAQPLVDAYTMATPLEIAKHKELVGAGQLAPQVIDYNVIAWKALSLAYAAGGLFLLYKKIITWHIPVAILGGLFVLALIFHTLDATAYASVDLHLLAGASIFGAFFIATDPVSSPTTAKGKWLYGLLIAGLIYTIRVWGTAYPDAIAFAVLLANFAVPTIDQLTKPITYGHKR